MFKMQIKELHFYSRTSYKLKLWRCGSITFFAYQVDSAPVLMHVWVWAMLQEGVVFSTVMEATSAVRWTYTEEAMEVISAMDTKVTMVDIHMGDTVTLKRNESVVYFDRLQRQILM